MYVNQHSTNYLFTPAHESRGVQIHMFGPKSGPDAKRGNLSKETEKFLAGTYEDAGGRGMRGEEE